MPSAFSRKQSGGNPAWIGKQATNGPVVEADHDEVEAWSHQSGDSRQAPRGRCHRQRRSGPSPDRTGRRSPRRRPGSSAATVPGWSPGCSRPAPATAPQRTWPSRPPRLMDGRWSPLMSRQGPAAGQRPCPVARCPFVFAAPVNRTEPVLSVEHGFSGVGLSTRPDEVDEALEIGGLVVVHREVAAVRAVAGSVPCGSLPPSSP